MRWKFLSVFVGVVTDIVISLLLGILFGLAMTVFLIAHGVAPHDLAPRLTALDKRPLIMLAGAGLGSFGTLVGGFVTGWIAGASRAVCGGIMGFCSCAAGIPFWSSEPLWYNALGVVMTLAMAIAGAFVAEAFFSRRQLHAPPR